MRFKPMQYFPGYETILDRRRRMLLGGVAGAVTSALLASACKPQEEKTSVAEPPPPAAPRKPQPAPPDLTTPPGAEPLSPYDLEWANHFLARQAGIDLHCHPGMFFMEDMTPEDPGIAKMAERGVFTESTVADMEAGGLSAALFATVADLRLLGVNERGLYARREFEPGEAYEDYRRQVVILQNMVDAGLVAPVTSPAEIDAARQARKVGAIFACEGGDFLEDKAERVSEAWDDGVRSIQLVHYHINQLGDIQTEAPKHNGLTDFGREVVAEMNRLGMIVDLAHATFETTRDAAEASTQPIMLSHSYIAGEGAQHPRLLSKEHAQLVAQTGGLIGAWPTGIGNPDFPAFIKHLLELVEAVGVDHVGLGTDMDANYKPVFTNYRQLPHIPVALRDGGMHEEEIAKVLGGNFRRLFETVTGE